MTDLESRLNAALGADPPARDALFRLEVLVRRERARFRRQLTLSLVAVLAAAILTGLSAPALLGWAGADPERLVVLVSLVAAAVVGLMRASFAAVPGVSTLAQRVERWFFA